MPIRYVTGDATAPTGSGPKIIAHVCNDVGAWGAGFVLAISRCWPQPEAAYLEWYDGREHNDFALGAVQLVGVEDRLWVANLIGQQGLEPSADGPPVRYRAIESALEELSAEALDRGASVHMPRIGCGLAGGEWDVVEGIIDRTLTTNHVEVIVYDLSTPVRSRSAS